MSTPCLDNPTLRTPRQAAHDMAQARRLAGNPEAADRIMVMLHTHLDAQARDADRRVKKARA